MLDQHKMREIKAYAPVLEIEESSWPTYERLAILRVLELFQEIQELGGIKSITSHAGGPHDTEPHRYSSRAISAGGSEFMSSIGGKDPNDVWPIMDELMETLKHVNGRVYNVVMAKIQAL